MLYDLSMHMGYVYDQPASIARHVIRVLPLSLPGRQRLIAGTITVTPNAEEKSTFIDFFGQQATSILLRASHERFDIRMQARVMVETPTISADLSPRLDGLRRELAAYLSVDGSSPHNLTGASPRLPEDPQIAAYARDVVKPGQTVLEIAKELCTRIYDDFKYDSKATKVDTTPREAFKLKRGVCQDFAHIMITALRSLAYARGLVIPASQLGKTKMVAEVIAILALILSRAGNGEMSALYFVGHAALWVVVVTALASAADYVRRFNVLLSPRIADITVARNQRSDRKAG